MKMIRTFAVVDIGGNIKSFITCKLYVDGVLLLLVCMCVSIFIVVTPFIHENVWLYMAIASILGEPT